MVTVRLVVRPSTMSLPPLTTTSENVVSLGAARSAAWAAAGTTDADRAVARDTAARAGRIRMAFPFGIGGLALSPWRDLMMRHACWTLSGPWWLSRGRRQFFERKGGVRVRRAGVG